MPNATGSYLGYNGQGSLTENLPNITGGFLDARSAIDSSSVTGVFIGSYLTDGTSGYGPTSYGSQIVFSASNSNSKYTSTDEVRPKTLRVNCIIKF